VSASKTNPTTNHRDERPTNSRPIAQARASACANSRCRTRVCNKTGNVLNAVQPHCSQAERGMWECSMMLCANPNPLGYTNKRNILQTFDESAHKQGATPRSLKIQEVEIREVTRCQLRISVKQDEKNPRRIVYYRCPEVFRVTSGNALFWDPFASPPSLFPLSAPNSTLPPPSCSIAVESPSFAGR